ncbi:MAG: hypothetical protein RMI91_09920 [Gemmatales bacterium]|nr:hypothetical protein [Gemmatales bacterium]MDW7994957.1 hypothetical protein [Gemmatales bacterium]
MPTDARIGVALGLLITLLLGLLLSSKIKDDDPATTSLRQFCRTVFAPVEPYLLTPAHSTPTSE